MTPLAFMDDLKRRYDVIIDGDEIDIEHKVDAVGENKNFDDDDVRGEINENNFF